MVFRFGPGLDCPRTTSIRRVCWLVALRPVPYLGGEIWPGLAGEVGRHIERVLVRQGVPCGARSVRKSTRWARAQIRHELVLVEAAWHYRHRPGLSRTLTARS